MVSKLSVLVLAVLMLAGCSSPQVNDVLHFLVPYNTPTSTPTVTLEVITKTKEIASTSLPVPTITKTSKASPTPFVNVCTRIGTGKLNLRSGPGMNYSVLKVLNENEVLAVHPNQPSSEWIHVIDKSGTEGWIYYEYVTHGGYDECISSK